MVNKGAETRLYMEQLEAAGCTTLAILWDPCLRACGLPRIRVYSDWMPPLWIESIPFSKAILATKKETVTNAMFAEDNVALDCYDFVKLLGGDSISWK